MYHKPESFELLQKVKSLIDQSQQIVILTGAGISTESGIPRSERRIGHLEQKESFGLM